MKTRRNPTSASRFFSPQSKSFVRAKAELELAQYMLKSDDLMLHPDFLQRLRSLPQSYVYGEYRQIYRDYGTHYITEAALGGDYEYTIILDKERLEKSGKACVIGQVDQLCFNFSVSSLTTSCRNILILCIYYCQILAFGNCSDNIRILSTANIALKWPKFVNNNIIL